MVDATNEFRFHGDFFWGSMATLNGDFRGFNGIYLLVKVYITMEHHHFYRVNQASMAISNSYVNVYQRVSKPYG